MVDLRFRGATTADIMAVTKDYPEAKLLLDIAPQLVFVVQAADGLIAGWIIGIFYKDPLMLQRSEAKDIIGLAVPFSDEEELSIRIVLFYVLPTHRNTPASVILSDGFADQLAQLYREGAKIGQITAVTKSKEEGEALMGFFGMTSENGSVFSRGFEDFVRNH